MLYSKKYNVTSYKWCKEIFSKLTVPGFPKECTIYSTDFYSHFLELKAQHAVTSLPQKASFGRFEPATPSQLTSTSHAECIINAGAGACCLLTFLTSLLNQSGSTFSSCIPEGGQAVLE